MKGFKLDQNGDVVINDNQIQTVSDIELIAQTIKQVINTNLGEWFGDEEEGIDYSVILTKNPNYELIKDTINTAVRQVSESHSIDIETDNFTFNVDGRNLTINFTITLNSKESKDISVSI